MDLSQFSSWVKVAIVQLMDLIDLCDQRGLPLRFSVSDLISQLDPAHEDVCLREIARYHRIVHDLLYAPPEK